MVNKKRLIEIPDDGIIKIPIMQGNSTVGERIIDLSHLPTVDAVEVVYGRWIMDDYTHRYRCSVCKAYQPYDTVGDYIDYWDCDYCPNCGAKMDGDGE